MVRIAAFVIVLLVSGSAWGQLDSCLETTDKNGRE